MSNSQRPNPSDILAAAQAALEAAQSVAGSAFDTAIRVPPASAQLVSQLPSLIENLAVATERLNVTLDRMERMLVLADPMFTTLDRLLPRLEQLTTVGDDVFRALASIPGVGTLGRITRISSGEPDPPPPPPRGTKSRTESLRRRLR